MTNVIPKGCRTSRSEPPIIILKNIISTDLLEILDNIITEYFFYLKNIKWLFIFKMRFGLNGNQPKLLSEMGREYNITRERIRQILFIMTSQIHKLLEGKELLNPRITCRKITAFTEFKNNLTSKIYTSAQIKKILGNFSKVQFINQYINILMFLCGYETVNRGEKQIYYKDILSYSITKNINKFRVFLSKQVLYISQSKIKKDLKLTQPELEFYIELTPNVETMIKGNEIFYRLPLKELHCASSCVYRILYEAGHPMPIAEIRSELKKNSRDLELISNNRCNGLYKKEIVPIGKTGVWSLREWVLNTDSIPALIEKCLKEEKHPLPIEQILVYINKYRPVYKHIIQSTLGVYKNVFIQYNDDTYGLKDWHLKKPVKIRRERNFTNAIKSSAIVEKAIEILREKKKMPLYDLRIKLSKKGYLLSTIYKALNNPIFIKEHSENMNKKKKLIHLKG
jgi:hypothetical protein